MIQYMNRQNKNQETKESNQNHNGEHQMMEVFQNKIGANIHVNLKKEIQIFGKSMKKSFGKITMHEYEQMVKMENMKKLENPLTNQIF